MKLKDGTTIKPEDVEAHMMMQIMKEILNDQDWDSEEERAYVEAQMCELTTAAAYQVKQSGGIQ